MLKRKEKSSFSIARDISWLAFNARVLQEAADETVPLQERIKFLGIYSNNQDEFFRVRVATLRRMAELGKKSNTDLADSPEELLSEIYDKVMEQQAEFNKIWKQIQLSLKSHDIHLLTEKQLNKEQQQFVQDFYDEEVSPNIIPMLLDHIKGFPYLREKAGLLAVKMYMKDDPEEVQYSIIEIPTRVMSRFVLLPSKPGTHNIILLEDVIRFSLPQIFSFLKYDSFEAYIIKITRDAEFDLDTDVSEPYALKIKKAIKSRKKGKPVRFVYDKAIDEGLLHYLKNKLGVKKKDVMIPGGRIHNFRHFMNFPKQVFPLNAKKRAQIIHKDIKSAPRVTDVVLKKDIMLHFPYHSFVTVITLLREAAMDPDVKEIMITAYRLASNSKIINALLNAHRNGKKVTVMLELRARFDEEANLEWKERLEDEGVTVLTGIADVKVHAKLCAIKKTVGNRIVQYGFVSTGNFNGQTAKLYGDHCLMTANRNIMADINRIFNYLKTPRTGIRHLKSCKTLIISPLYMRKTVIEHINNEIKHALNGKKASIIFKLNSLSDEAIIAKLREAAIAGVKIELIIRGICCFKTENKKFLRPVKAISIIDELLEHARVLIFNNGGKPKVMISSADLMVRNLDHRIEAGVYIQNKHIAQELQDILQIQLNDNVKARILDNEQKNDYVATGKRKVRSQWATFNYISKL